MCVCGFVCPRARVRVCVDGGEGRGGALSLSLIQLFSALVRASAGARVLCVCARVLYS